MAVILGYLFLFINVVVVIMMTTDKLLIYLDFHSSLCVVGGTILSAIIAFGPKSVKRLLEIYVTAAKGRPSRMEAIIHNIVQVSNETKGEITSAFVSNLKVDHPFLKDAIALIADGFTRDQMSVILRERIESTHGRYKEDERMMKALAKIPPSFGLLGTTVGLIALFAEVGGTDALKKIGPAMAVALTATLYGVLVAFAILNPMVERVIAMSFQDLDEREVIFKGSLLLKEKSSPVYIEEVLKSYLSPKQRQRGK